MRRVLRKNGVLFAIQRSPDNVDGLTTERDNKLTKKEGPTILTRTEKI